MFTKVEAPYILLYILLLFNGCYFSNLIFLDKSKAFIWPDKAILLLLELYREREEDFSNGIKRANKIWTEIAIEMKKANPKYEVTSQQCTTKLAGLKRTYKNIIDQNKKSGNHRNSWEFFSVRMFCHISNTCL